MARKPAPQPAQAESIERFETLTISRSQVKEAPYNPRKMAPEAARNLRRGISKLGILQPIVWNKRTGNIVGGHQRIAAMDSMHKGKDYTLTVAAVDLDDKREKEANLLLNNGAAQGEFDMEKLEALFKTGDIDVAATGWTEADLFRLFGDSPLGSPAEPNKGEKSVEEAIDRLMEMDRAANEIKAAAFERDREDFYMVVVFRDYASRKAFTDAHGLEDNRYQSADVVFGELGKE